MLWQLPRPGDRIRDLRFTGALLCAWAFLPGFLKESMRMTRGTLLSFLSLPRQTSGFCMFSAWSDVVFLFRALVHTRQCLMTRNLALQLTMLSLNFNAAHHRVIGWLSLKPSCGPSASEVLRGPADALQAAVKASPSWDWDFNGFQVRSWVSE